SESDLANSTLNLGTIQADEINIGRGTTNVNVLGKATFDNAIIADDSLGVTDAIAISSSGVVLETKLDVLGVTSTFGSDTQSFLTVDHTGTVTVENADVVWTSNYPFDAHNIDPLEITTATITGTTVLEIDSPSGTFVNIATDTAGGGLVLGRDNLSVITANSLFDATKGLKTDEIYVTDGGLTIAAADDATTLTVGHSGTMAISMEGETIDLTGKLTATNGSSSLVLDPTSLDVVGSFGVTNSDTVSFVTKAQGTATVKAGTITLQEMDNASGDLGSSLVMNSGVTVTSADASTSYALTNSGHVFANDVTLSDNLTVDGDVTVNGDAVTATVGAITATVGGVTAQDAAISVSSTSNTGSCAVDIDGPALNVSLSASGGSASLDMDAANGDLSLASSTTMDLSTVDLTIGASASATLSAVTALEVVSTATVDIEAGTSLTIDAASVVIGDPLGTPVTATVDITSVAIAIDGTATVTTTTPVHAVVVDTSSTVSVGGTSVLAHTADGVDLTGTLDVSSDTTVSGLLTTTGGLTVTGSALSATSLTAAGIAANGQVTLSSTATGTSTVTMDGSVVGVSATTITLGDAGSTTTAAGTVSAGVVAVDTSLTVTDYLVADSDLVTIHKPVVGTDLQLDALSTALLLGTADSTNGVSISRTTATTSIKGLLDVSEATTMSGGLTVSSIGADAGALTLGAGTSTSVIVTPAMTTTASLTVGSDLTVSGTVYADAIQSTAADTDLSITSTKDLDIVAPGTVTVTSDTLSVGDSDSLVTAYTAEDGWSMTTVKDLEVDVLSLTLDADDSVSIVSKSTAVGASLNMGLGAVLSAGDATVTNAEVSLKSTTNNSALSSVTLDGDSVTISSTNSLQTGSLSFENGAATLTATGVTSLEGEDQLTLTSDLVSIDADTTLALDSVAITIGDASAPVTATVDVTSAAIKLTGSSTVTTATPVHAVNVDTSSTVSVGGTAILATTAAGVAVTGTLGVSSGTTVAGLLTTTGGLTVTGSTLSATALTSAGIAAGSASAGSANVSLASTTSNGASSVTLAGQNVSITSATKVAISTPTVTLGADAGSSVSTLGSFEAAEITAASLIVTDYLNVESDKVTIHKNVEGAGLSLDATSGNLSLGTDAASLDVHISHGAATTIVKGDATIIGALATNTIDATSTDSALIIGAEDATNTLQLATLTVNKVAGTITAADDTIVATDKALTVTSINSHTSSGMVVTSDVGVDVIAKTGSVTLKDDSSNSFGFTYVNPNWELVTSQSVALECDCESHTVTAGKSFSVFDTDSSEDALLKVTGSGVTITPAMTTVQGLTAGASALDSLSVSGATTLSSTLSVSNIGAVGLLTLGTASSPATTGVTIVPALTVSSTMDVSGAVTADVSVATPLVTTTSIVVDSVAGKAGDVVTVNDALSVTGDVTVGGNLISATDLSVVIAGTDTFILGAEKFTVPVPTEVAGGVTSTSLTVTSALSVTSSAATLSVPLVGSAVSIYGTGSLSLGTNASSGPVNVSQAGVATTVLGSLLVTEATTLSSTLSVSTIGASGVLTIGTTATTGVTINKNTTLSEKLNVAKDLTVDGSLLVDTLSAGADALTLSSTDSISMVSDIVNLGSAGDLVVSLESSPSVHWNIATVKDLEVDVASLALNVDAASGYTLGVNDVDMLTLDVSSFEVSSAAAVLPDTTIPALTVTELTSGNDSITLSKDLDVSNGFTISSTAAVLKVASNYVEVTGDLKASSGSVTASTGLYAPTITSNTATLVVGDAGTAISLAGTVTTTGTFEVGTNLTVPGVLTVPTIESDANVSITPNSGGTITLATDILNVGVTDTLSVVNASDKWTITTDDPLVVDGKSFTANVADSQGYTLKVNSSKMVEVDATDFTVSTTEATLPNTAIPTLTVDSITTADASNKITLQKSLSVSDGFSIASSAASLTMTSTGATIAGAAGLKVEKLSSTSGLSVTGTVEFSGAVSAYGGINGDSGDALILRSYSDAASASELKLSYDGTTHLMKTTKPLEISATSLAVTSAMSCTGTLTVASLLSSSDLSVSVGGTADMIVVSASNGLTVAGDITATDSTVTAASVSTASVASGTDLAIAGTNVSVTGSITLDGDVDATSDLDVGGNLTAVGTASVGSLTVSGATVLSGAFTVPTIGASGVLTLGASGTTSITINKATTLSNTLTVSGALVASTTIAATTSVSTPKLMTSGDMTIDASGNDVSIVSSSVTLSGSLEKSTDLTVAIGSAQVKNYIMGLALYTVPVPMTVTGEVSATSVSASGAVSGASLTVATINSVDSSVLAINASTLTMTAATNIVGNVGVTGTLTLSDTLTVNSGATVTGSLAVDTITATSLSLTSDTLNFGTSSDLSLVKAASEWTLSTSLNLAVSAAKEEHTVNETTGTFSVLVGASEKFAVNKSSTTIAALDVTGDTTIGGSLKVSDVWADGEMTIGGDASSGTVTIDPATVTSSSLTVKGALIAETTVGATTSVTTPTLYGTSNNLAITASTGVTVTAATLTLTGNIAKASGSLGFTVAGGAYTMAAGALTVPGTITASSGAITAKSLVSASLTTSDDTLTLTGGSNVSLVGDVTIPGKSLTVGTTLDVTGAATVGSLVSPSVTTAAALTLTGTSVVVAADTLNVGSSNTLGFAHADSAWSLSTTDALSVKASGYTFNVADDEMMVLTGAALTVSSTTTTLQAATINNGLTVGSITNSDAISVTATNTITLDSNTLAVTGNITKSSSLGITIGAGGSYTVAETLLTVPGGITASSGTVTAQSLKSASLSTTGSILSLSSAGTISLGQPVTTTEGLTVGSTLDVTTALTVGTTLGVTGVATVGSLTTSALTSDAALTLTGTSTAIVSDTLTLGDSSTAKLEVAHDASTWSVDTNDEALTIDSGALTVDATGYSLKVSGSQKMLLNASAFTISSTKTTLLETSITNGLTVDSITSSNDSITLSKPLDVPNTFVIESTGGSQLAVTSSGVTLSGDLTVDTIKTSETLAVEASMSVTKDVTVAGDVFVTGNVSSPADGGTLDFKVKSASDAFASLQLTHEAASSTLFMETTAGLEIGASSGVTIANALTCSAGVTVASITAASSLDVDVGGVDSVVSLNSSTLSLKGTLNATTAVIAPSITATTLASTSGTLGINATTLTLTASTAMVGNVSITGTLSCSGQITASQLNHGTQLTISGSSTTLMLNDASGLVMTHSSDTLTFAKGEEWLGSTASALKLESTGSTLDLAASAAVTITGTSLTVPSTLYSPDTSLGIYVSGSTLAGKFYRESNNNRLVMGASDSEIEKSILEAGLASVSSVSSPFAPGYAETVVALGSSWSNGSSYYDVGVDVVHENTSSVHSSIQIVVQYMCYASGWKTSVFKPYTVTTSSSYWRLSSGNLRYYGTYLDQSTMSGYACSTSYPVVFKIQAFASNPVTDTLRFIAS
ncbi:hypothetical protein KIPB_003117, partial [Kipferlia bialata]